jgi:hypothetical protein
MSDTYDSCSVCDGRIDPWGRDGVRCARCNEPCPTCHGDVARCHHQTGAVHADAPRYSAGQWTQSGGDVTALTGHPEYSRGYFDAIDGCIRQGEQSEEYRLGYAAGKDAVEMFTRYGFTQRGRDFSITFRSDEQ